MTPLDIAHLSVRYGQVAALDDVSLTVAAGEIVALVGPSGSGKSTLAAAALALLPGNAVAQGALRIEGTDVTTLDEAALQRVRGGRIGMIFQEPATALNPALTIGRQIGEVLAQHTALGRPAIAAEVDALLRRVGLDLSSRRYPHTLSGGQRQRVAIAIAIAANPPILLADEPTAALDPVAQARIVALLTALVRERDMGLLLVTHDLGVAQRTADRIVALDRGRIVTRDAAQAAPPPRRQPRSGEGRVLALRDVARTYPARGGRVLALSDVSLSLARGETLAVIGESGSGKSTLARLALGLDLPDAGVVTIRGRDWRSARGGALRALRRSAQAVFQDAGASFDPRQTVGAIVAEPLHLLDDAPAGEKVAMVLEALAQVGLSADVAGRLPQALSGGQRQRVAIARALILKPDLVVLDEALSALDHALRGEIIALLLKLQDEHALAYLFIGHGMDVVRQIADRVIVLRHGRVVEQGAVDAVLDRPRDPYVAALAGSAE